MQGFLCRVEDLLLRACTEFRADLRDSCFFFRSRLAAFCLFREQAADELVIGAQQGGGVWASGFLTDFRAVFIVASVSCVSGCYSSMREEGDRMMMGMGTKEKQQYRTHFFSEQV
jgi:hypothetical protein